MHFIKSKLNTLFNFKDNFILEKCHWLLDSYSRVNPFNPPILAGWFGVLNPPTRFDPPRVTHPKMGKQRVGPPTRQFFFKYIFIFTVFILHMWVRFWYTFSVSISLLLSFTPPSFSSQERQRAPESTVSRNRHSRGHSPREAESIVASNRSPDSTAVAASHRFRSSVAVASLQPVKLLLQNLYFPSPFSLLRRDHHQSTTTNKFKVSPSHLLYVPSLFLVLFTGLQNYYVLCSLANYGVSTNKLLFLSTDVC